MVPCFRIPILDNITAAASLDGLFTSERRSSSCLPIGGDGSNSGVLGMPTLFTSEKFNQGKWAPLGEMYTHTPTCYGKAKRSSYSDFGTTVSSMLH